MASITDRLPLVVGALGLTQITAWGTSYYCLGVLAGPIARDTGWSPGLVYLGFTVSVLVMGAVSAWAGQAIDRHGARTVMSVGCLLTSAGLLLLSTVRNEADYLLAWAGLGLGMRLSLYDAAFAALVQVFPTRGRSAISILTLFGAFASTVFWQVGHALNQTVGWRRTLVAFAVINLVVCLPLIRWSLAHRMAPTPPAAPATMPGPDAEAPLEGRARRIGIALFALVLSLNGFVFGAMTVQLVPLLQAAGLGAAAAVGVASLKGFAQFGGRLVEIVFGRRLRAVTVGRVAIGALPWAFVVLLLAGGRLEALLVFTLLMGASQGVITIVRGAVPLALFGALGYGRVLGLLATPVLVVNAASPTLIALVVEAWGWDAAMSLLLAAAAGSWAAMEAMARWVDRQHVARGA
jgi:hypothetical protein